MGIGHWPAALPLHAAPQNAGTSADEVTIGGWQRVFLALRCQEKAICPLLTLGGSLGRGAGSWNKTAVAL